MRSRYRKEKSGFAQGFGAGMGYGCAVLVITGVMIVLALFGLRACS